MGDTDDAVSVKALREHVERLTSSGPRHGDNPAAVLAALEYIAHCLTSYGYAVEPERYGRGRHEVNLLASTSEADDRAVLEIGAHWDTVRESAGADDNASGVAGLLEVARILVGAGQRSRALRFCVFGGEEDQPLGSTGSRAHVARLEATAVEGAIVLEMIGYRDRRPGSQRLPDDPEVSAADLVAAGFDRADFIAAIGNLAAADHVAAVSRAASAQDPPLRVASVTVRGDHGRNASRSDHLPYWLSGRKGVMITDTAEFRNANYHRPTDTIDTLDFDFAAAVTGTLADALRALSA